MPRPRTSPDPHAARWRSPDLEVSGKPTTFELPAEATVWLQETQLAFKTYVESESARVLRAEDYSDICFYFALTDRVNRLLSDWPAGKVDAETRALRQLKQWETMRDSLRKHLAMGPVARARHGVTTNEKPGSKLDAFLRGERLAEEAL